MILLLDTSTPQCRLTLVDGSDRHIYEWQADRQLAHGLLAFIRDKLDERGLTWQNITAIGAFSGPGSFTGLRIGLTVLNTIADAEKLPIVGATGDNWQEIALARLESNENDEIILPLYGSDARITTPRK